MRVRIEKLNQSLTMKRQLGFVMIGVLLLLLLVSAIAITVAYTTNTERAMSGSDEDNNLSYYAAEAGMEKMTSDLSQLFAATSVPSPAAISALGSSANMPVLPGVDYTLGYSLSCDLDGNGSCSSTDSQISSGPYKDLHALLMPITLNVIATRDTVSNAQTSLTRRVEVGLIPVFQFGVFSQMDLSFFPGPTMQFDGRVHTNGNLWVTHDKDAYLVFHDKITAAGDVIVTSLANGATTGKVNGTCYQHLVTENPACAASNPGYQGPVLISTAPPAGCPTNSVANAITIDANTVNNSCIELTTGSLQNNLVAPETKYWPTFVKLAKGQILNGSAGATPLSLPFVQPGVGPIEIIRQPLPLEDPTTSVGQSRLYNEAQIRVLLADTPGDLYGGGKPGDVFLDNVAPFANGITVSNALGGGPTYFANGEQNGGDPDWKNSGPAGGAPVNNHGDNPVTWPLLGGWLRVEAHQKDGTWKNVTQEWLGLGFARGTQVPDSEHPAGVGTFNSVHPNAILIFQKVRPNLGHALTGTDVSGAGTQYNWYPINLYDSREGLYGGNAANSPNNPSGDNCPIAGVMNVVELDVRNLQRWLSNQIGTTGGNVENTSQNGYILYFSDRRGMLPDPDPSVTENGKRGDWGYPQQGLDIKQDGNIETYGAKNIGDGFFSDTTHDGSPTILISCQHQGQKYPVSAARHGLKVIDGTSGNLPAATFTFNAKGQVTGHTGGFTVASEQPVYVMGNYNANDGDGFSNWASDHVPSAIIADSVTLLSQGWTDENDFANPLNLGNRPATESRFRLAMAAGKNVTWQNPAKTIRADWGTDGGVHNFLRYLENWNTTSHYRGSMVSFFYSHYGTGVFKTGEVYSPPTRDYSFDTDFTSIKNMPPGTPHLLNITNLNYHQDFSPR